MYAVECGPGKIGDVTVVTMRCGSISGVLIGDTIHVLGHRSSSSYGMTVPTGLRVPYICQDGCCDRGLRDDVSALVLAAIPFGAAKVILRMGQGSYRVSQIHELPVEDVTNHVGTPVEGISINRR